MRYLTQWMKLLVGFRMRVLLCDPRTELDMLTHGFAELLIGGQTRLVQGFQINLDEALPLLIGDLQAAMPVDEVRESQFAAETAWATEGFGGEPGQMIDVGGRRSGKT